jgi:hypothetical protein
MKAFISGFMLAAIIVGTAWGLQMNKLNNLPALESDDSWGAKPYQGAGPRLGQGRELNRRME